MKSKLMSQTSIKHNCVLEQLKAARQQDDQLNLNFYFPDCELKIPWKQIVLNIKKN